MRLTSCTAVNFDHVWLFMRAREREISLDVLALYRFSRALIVTSATFKELFDGFNIIFVYSMRLRECVVICYTCVDISWNLICFFERRWLDKITRFEKCDVVWIDDSNVDIIPNSNHKSDLTKILMRHKLIQIWRYAKRKKKSTSWESSRCLILSNVQKIYVGPVA